MIKKISFFFAYFLFGITVFSGGTHSADSPKPGHRSVWNQSFEIALENTQISLPQEATAFAVRIPENSDLFIQTEGGDWRKIQLEEEDPELTLIPETPDFAYFQTRWSIPVFADRPFDTFRFRLESKSADQQMENINLPSQEISFSFMDTRAQTQNLEVVAGPLLGSGLHIISRSEWGADESLRFYESEKSSQPETLNRDIDSSSLNRQRFQGCNDLHLDYPDEFDVSKVVHTDVGRQLAWPYQYSEKIEKIVFHHTAGSNDPNRDPKEIMRSIYAYHARTRGWGDIGYHFVIDRNGNIYEGRAGGDFVIGGHVYCSNVQTIGVAFMGNFEEGRPTSAQIDAAERLLPHLAETYNLDISGESVFHGKKLPNLLGHRDLGATACPGGNMYTLLESIRKGIRSSHVIQSIRQINRAAEFTGTVNLLKLNPGKRGPLTLEFKNTGNISWNSSTWLYVVNPRTGVAALSKRNGKSYVAGLLKENNVPPGGTGTFSVDVQSGFEGGLYSLEFTPVVDQRKISDAAIVQPVEVIAPHWAARFDKNDIVTQPEIPLAAERISLSLPVKNTGSTEWKREYISASISVNGKQYEASLQEPTVLQNKIGHFTVSLDPFADAKRYLMRARLLVNGRNMPGVSTFIIPFEVREANIRAKLISSKVIKTGMTTEGVTGSEIAVTNTGNLFWNKDEVELFVIGNGNKYTFRMQEDGVGPKETAHFAAEFSPSTTGRLLYSFWIQKGSRKIFGSHGKWIVTRGSGHFIRQRTIVEQKKATQEIFQDLSQKNIRIRLGYESDSATVTASNDFDVILDNEKIGEVEKGKTVKIEKSGTSVLFNGKHFASVRLVPQDERGIFTISSWDRKPIWDTSGRYNDNKFRGTLEFRLYHDALTVINELPLEQYVWGLAETGNDTHQEKRKVIAILARSYALFYMNPENRKFPGAPYDGDDSPERFQKYLGYEYEIRNRSFTDAVRQTEGIVVTYNGKLIKTPYFSQSDGRTRSAQEVWGWTDTPYLQSVDDPFCKGLELKGHGVGLSGCGAEAAAQGGKAYEEIIKYYYQGVGVGKL